MLETRSAQNHGHRRRIWSKSFRSDGIHKNYTATLDRAWPVLMFD